MQTGLSIVKNSIGFKYEKYYRQKVKELTVEILAFSFPLTFNVYKAM